MKKYILDSSFLLSLYISEDINHEEALEIFESLEEDCIFYMDELWYSELLTVITYKKGFSHAKEMKEILLSLGVFFIHSGTFEYISLFESLEKRVSVVDVSIIYDAIKYESDILSFDKELTKIHKKLR